MNNEGTVEMVQTISFSGLAADTKRLRIPRGRYDAVTVNAEYIVKDVGISAGENFDGLIDEMYIGEGGNKPIWAKRDEMARIANFSAAEFNEVKDGAVYDPTPTTEVKCYSHFTFFGPFQFNSMGNPELVMSLKDIIEEFGEATSFQATIRIVLHKADNEGGLGVYLNRESRPSDTLHNIPLGPSHADDMLIVLSGPASTISVPAKGADGKKAPSAMVLNTKNPWLYEHAYMIQQKLSAPESNAYFVEDMNLGPYPGREVTIECAAAQTALVITRNIVG